MEQSQQLYSVSVEQNDGFGFGVSYTKDQVYSLLEEYINTNQEDYDKIIEDGGIETDEAEICITALATHKSETLDDLPSEFDRMTLALAKDGADIKRELTPEQANLWHMATGISGEAGEVEDAIKKHVVYQKPLDVENVKEELGDLLFYMSNLMQSVGLSFKDVLQHNIDKLSVRYSSGKYSDEQAQQRADKLLTGETE